MPNQLAVEAAELIGGSRDALPYQGDRLDLLGGSICWQVGNHVNGSARAQEVYPLDIVLYPLFKNLGLKLRNRIVWHFEHGLHCSQRFSGRQRVELARSGLLRTRPMDRPVYAPSGRERVAQRPADFDRNPTTAAVDSSRTTDGSDESADLYALERGYTKRLLLYFSLTEH